VPATAFTLIVATRGVVQTASFMRKKSRGICVTAHCRRRAARHKNYCHTCRSRQYRKRHPIRYAYFTVKTHAKTRGIEFNITFKEFEAFCLKTNYHLLRGNMPGSLTIDRRDSSQGYHVDNIRTLSHQENSTRQDECEDDEADEFDRCGCVTKKRRSHLSYRCASRYRDDVDRPF
jgi:hypothetical protein